MNNIDSIRNELDTLTKIIVESVPVEAIYLFGSYAYGTPNNNSDIDIYLVFKDDMQMREMDAFFAVQKAVYPVQKRAIDFLGHKKDKFISRSTGFSTVEKDISAKGIKLYG